MLSTVAQSVENTRQSYRIIRPVGSVTVKQKVVVFFRDEAGIITCAERG